jgi:hypothetical protein
VLQVHPRKETVVSEPAQAPSQQEALGSMPNTPFSQEGSQGDDNSDSEDEDDDDNDKKDETDNADQQKSVYNC